MSARQIDWVYDNRYKGYLIYMAGAGQVGFTRTEAGRDLFIATLKATNSATLPPYVDSEKERAAARMDVVGSGVDFLDPQPEPPPPPEPDRRCDGCGARADCSCGFWHGLAILIPVVVFAVMFVMEVFR